MSVENGLYVVPAGAPGFDPFATTKAKRAIREQVFAQFGWVEAARFSLKLKGAASVVLLPEAQRLFDQHQSLGGSSDGNL